MLLTLRSPAVVLGMAPLSVVTGGTLRQPGVFGPYTRQPVNLVDVGLGPRTTGRVIRPPGRITVVEVARDVLIPGPIGPTGPPGPMGSFPVATKTSDYSVSSAESQTTFDNAGAVGPVVFSLPPASHGLRYSFIVLSAQVLEVLAAGGDQITIGTRSGGSAQSDVPNSFISFIVPEGLPNLWVAQSVAGTWSLT